MDGQVRVTGLAVLFGGGGNAGLGGICTMMFRMKRDEHVVRETEFCNFLRRHLKDPSLFTAYNVKEGRWFLAYWVRKDIAVAYDVEDLGANLELAHKGLVKQLERSREGVTKDDMKKALLHKEARGIEIETRDAEEFQEMQNWTQKKSGSPIPALLG